MRALVRSILLLVFACTAACGPTVDLTQGLHVDVLDTGWFDAGIVNGQNKLVPSVTFTLKNTSTQKLATLQVNALFRRVTEKDEWGSGFVTAAGSSGLAPGATTPPMTIRSQLGYTGSDQSRQEMLGNSHFVDAKVEIFAKYGSAQWTPMGEYPITRKLIEKPPRSAK
ncbi:MAG: hypothetical protein DMG01_14215 [Acidobacteria bacterium]|nr:MAG: hypothetical protein DMG01_14215 [Acidobacteriota bacterium]PYR04735.1 MAG: hypothetical protein DMG00_22850 [Acidobacteriota bacterium]